jgi:hypothetical protein
VIYKFRFDQDIFEQNEGLRVVEKYAKLTDRQMKFVSLVCDPSHDNPVRTLQGKDKREKAALLAGYKRESDNKRLDKNAREISEGKVPSVEAAIEEFKTLHYDQNTDTLETLNSQINEIKEFLKVKKNNDPKALKAALDLGTKLPELVEAKIKIESLLNVSLNQKPEFDPKESVGIEIVNSVGEETEGEQTLATIDRVMMEMQKNKE